VTAGPGAATGPAREASGTRRRIGTVGRRYRRLTLELSSDAAGLEPCCRCGGMRGLGPQQRFSQLRATAAAYSNLHVRTARQTAPSEKQPIIAPHSRYDRLVTKSGSRIFRRMGRPESRSRRAVATYW
jgi:hypothetical protein